MRAFALIGIAALGLTVTSVRSEEITCRLSGYSVHFNGDSHVSTGTVTSGKPCRFIHSPGSGQGPDGRGYNAFEAIKVISPPKHGSATVISATEVEYISKPGFKGSDSFSYVAFGHGRQGNTSSTVNATFDVQ